MRVLIGVGVVLASTAQPLVAQQYTDSAGDPSADRALVTANARQLPAGAVTLTGHWFLILPAVSYGHGGWATFTLGSSPIALLAAPRGHFVYGSAKFRLIERPTFALGVGDFFTTMGWEDTHVAAHWPFLVGTIGGDVANLSGTVGYGFGDLTIGYNQSQRWAFQVAGSARLGRGARLVGEVMRLEGQSAMALLALRLWDQRLPWFLELGGLYAIEPLSPGYPWLPWFSLGLRVK